MDWNTLYCPNKCCRYYGIPFQPGKMVKNGSSHGQLQALCRGCGGSVALSYATAYFDCLRTVASLYSMVPRGCAVSNDTGEQAHCVANAWSVHAAYVLASRTDTRCTRSSRCPCVSAATPKFEAKRRGAWDHSHDGMAVSSCGYSASNFAAPAYLRYCHGWRPFFSPRKVSVTRNQVASNDSVW
jgi:hypothetical protein